MEERDGGPVHGHLPAVAAAATSVRASLAPCRVVAAVAAAAPSTTTALPLGPPTSGPMEETVRAAVPPRGDWDRGYK